MNSTAKGFWFKTPKKQTVLRPQRARTVGKPNDKGLTVFMWMNLYGVKLLMSLMQWADIWFSTHPYVNLSVAGTRPGVKQSSETNTSLHAHSRGINFSCISNYVGGNCSYIVFRPTYFEPLYSPNMNYDPKRCLCKLSLWLITFTSGKNPGQETISSRCEY